MSINNNVKRMDIKEFRRLGFLQEANRLFFHPLGLALEIIVDYDSGEERLGGIWDYREDPEGIAFAEGVIKQERIDYVASELEARMSARQRFLGSGIIQTPESTLND